MTIFEMARPILAVLLLTASATAVACDESPSARIDAILQSTFDAQSIQPAPLCNDDQFLRRLTLDLWGRIPTLDELRQFRANPDRKAAIDRMLADEQFNWHLADAWTAWLIGYSNAYQVDRELFRQWLYDQFRNDVPFDEIATHLLTATGSTALDGPVNFLARHRDEPVIKVSRTFLGVRLDCARCHDHPYDRWTQDDFQRMSRFFSTMQNREVDGIRQIVDRAIRSNEFNDDTAPRFLTGSVAKSGRWRDELALYVVNCKPFARNFANRLWYQMLGRGIVEPPDDFNVENPAAVPELLEYLSELAVENDFAIKPLVHAICNSHAYQRTTLASAGATEVSEQQRLFAVRTLKPLTLEQYLASVEIVTEFDPNGQPRRRQIATLLGSSLNDDQGETWKYDETVQQLMQKLAQPIAVIPVSHEEIYQRILSRNPTEREREIAREFIAPDLFYALIHSNEFYFNH